MKDLQWYNQHLLWRAAFGPAFEYINKINKLDTGQLFGEMLKTSAKDPEYIDVSSNYLKGLMLGIGEADKMNKREMTDDEKRELRRQSHEDIKNLNLRWLDEMVNSNAQLKEKMAFFWHGHFACRNLNVYYQQLLLHTIRTNALGDFRLLLREVSKSAAMINFLNNNQNRKDHPNENFARELLELFTMGRGNYTEDDIKEAARAFTGWGTNLKGEFVFRKMLHDSGQKSFLGRKGNFTGDDIIDIVLEQPATATFLVKKIYRFFVNENLNTRHVDWLAKRWLQSGYNITSLLRDIYTSNWFYEKSSIGNRIKSPVELWVGLKRQLPLYIGNESTQLVLQKLLGQILFYPPNVAGWPSGKAWIDSSSLLIRLRLPELLAVNSGMNMKPKDDDDQQMGNPAKSGRSFESQIYWNDYYKEFETVQRPTLMQSVSRFVLQTEAIPSPGLLAKHTDESSRSQYIKSLTIALMSCPEYQLC